MNNQTLERNYETNFCLETNLKINEILVAYPDNYLDNLGKIFITKAYYIRPSSRNSLDIRIEGNSYQISKYDEINPKLKDFVDLRIKEKSKDMGGFGGALSISRRPEQSVKIFDKDSGHNILELTLLRTRDMENIKFAKFTLWGDNLNFLRSELKGNYFQHKLGGITK